MNSTKPMMSAATAHSALLNVLVWVVCTQQMIITVIAWQYIVSNVTIWMQYRVYTSKMELEKMVKRFGCDWSEKDKCSEDSNNNSRSSFSKCFYKLHIVIFLLCIRQPPRCVKKEMEKKETALNVSIRCDNRMIQWN